MSSPSFGGGDEKGRWCNEGEILDVVLGNSQGFLLLAKGFHCFGYGFGI
jgi:hypothetical protein